MTKIIDTPIFPRVQRDIDDVSNLEGYVYRLWEYNASHSFLKLQAFNKDKSKPSLMLTFSFVAYLQIFLEWQGDLRLASETEHIEIAKSAGFVDDEKIPINKQLQMVGLFLFKANTQQGNVYILGSPEGVKLYS